MNVSIRADLYIIVFAAIVFSGLAAYVLSRRPNKPVSWLFAATCLALSIFYVSALFLFPDSTAPAPLSTPVALRIRWVVISFSMALFPHLAWFHFTPAWKQRSRPLVFLLYALAVTFSLSAFLSDSLVAGTFYHSPGTMLGQVNGPLMSLFLFLVNAVLLLSLGGLVVRYRSAQSSNTRRQVYALLMPFALLLVTTDAFWAETLTIIPRPVPSELYHALLLLTGISFAWAVLRHGAVANQPIQRDYRGDVIVTFLLGTLLIALGLYIDRWLERETPLSFPLTTTLFLIIGAMTYPVLRPYVIAPLVDRVFGEQSRGAPVPEQLALTPGELSHPIQLQQALLDTLCQLLGVGSGFIALAHNGNEAPEGLVHFVYGETPLCPGDTLSLPPLPVTQPPVAASWPDEGHAALDDEEEWQDAALVCPLQVNGVYHGVLALGKKKNGAAFSSLERKLCSDVAQRLNHVQQMQQLSEKQIASLQVAEQHDRELQQISQQFVADGPLPADGQQVLAPVEIRALGPLRVHRQGELVSEAEWTTEKAKGLLAYLLWKGADGAKREELATALWPERTDEGTANVFHVTLHRLRRVLEPERKRGSGYVLHSRGHYSFDDDAPFWLDVVEFERLAQRKDELSLQRAVSLYRGAYFEDMAWALPPEAEGKRRRLEDLYLNALRRLIAQSEGQQMEQHLHQLLAVEPLDEAARQALTASYVRRGRRDLALQQIQRWREALDELGLDPSPETEAFWREVRAQGV